MLRTIAASLAICALCACSPNETAPPTQAPTTDPAAADPSPADATRSYSEQRVACEDRNPQRNAYFGDFHVHTDVSMDAYIFGTRTTARDAYRFARGEAISSPLESAELTQMLQLERPLDFAAVTDHASFLGEVKLCTTQGSPAYDSVMCQIYRGEVEVELPEGLDLGGHAVTAAIGTRMAMLMGGNGEPASGGEMRRSAGLCGADGSVCRQWSKTVWDDEQAAADEAYDRSSSCRFTAFKAYEYTATPELSKVHRNIIFRNDAVIDLPIAYADVPDAYDMWDALREQCLRAGTGCDVVSIPHNSNLSNGRMFQIDYADLPEAEQLERVKLRAELEPLAEIMQIKGDSECRNGLSGVLGGTDELCDFERYRAVSTDWEDCGDGGGGGELSGKGCISRRDYVRYAIVEALREEERLGVNPFKLGFIASTDAHNSNPGDVQERSFDGWSGVQDSTPERRLQGGIGALQPIASNPGGLVGIWAEENSRDSLFDSMKRRETFGTSGPRIQPRFFGGWSYAADLCDAPEWTERAYAAGVPMGGDLPTRPADAAAPSFVVSALRDPGSEAFPGGKLQRIQIIKGWAGEDGAVHQRVFDVAGMRAGEAASVDPATCEPQGAGHETLCAVWSDPEFDPTQRAVYYSRVVENPSCRWSAWQCLALPEAERPAACDDPAIPKLIQERAWTSPIWYTPPEEASK